MDVVRGRPEGRDTELRTTTFTETVYGDPVLAADGVTVNNVTFGPRGRTYWHSHPGGQVLFARLGAGFVANRDGESVEIRAGDVVHASGGEEHWHGGGPHTMLTHTAVSLGTTVWLEEVTDADYDAAVDRAH